MPTKPSYVGGKQLVRFGRGWPMAARVPQHGKRKASALAKGYVALYTGVANARSHAANLFVTNDTHSGGGLMEMGVSGEMKGSHCVGHCSSLDPASGRTLWVAWAIFVEFEDLQCEFKGILDSAGGI